MRLFTLVLKGHIAIAAQRSSRTAPPALPLDCRSRSSFGGAPASTDHGTGHGVGGFFIGA